MTNKKKLPYVLSDLDGTISDSSLTISEQTAEDILAYQTASGGRFSFVTGRLAEATKFLAYQLKVSLPIISCNGALVSDWKTKKIFYVKYLDSNLTIKIIRKATNFGIQPVISTETQLAGLTKNPRILMWKKHFKTLPSNLQCEILEFNQIDNLIAAISKQVIKPIQLVLYASTTQQQKATRQIIKEYESQIEAVPSLEHVFNITALGTNKLTGLKAFAKVLEIDYRDIVVFGDNYNDVSMIKGVKRGFVVANGVPELKKIAYEIVPAIDKNGVGKTLKIFAETETYD